ncbi:MAG TPA: metal ABC transporter permease [Mycobacteriales bacterium]|nr:metal ABC transporter permease [Mycobacteriales bacterium]
MSWERALEPFAFEFFRNGMVVATLAGALCGLIGVYVVLRGMSYIGHGLSHSIFGGAVASSVFGINVLAGAAIWGFASALMISGITRRRAIGGDAAIGVITTAAFAIGVALISVRRSFTQNFDALLFGNVLGVERGDIVVIALVSAGAVAVVFFGYRQLLFTTFDPEVAETSGVRTARVDALFSLVLAMSIIATMRILGVTLIAAALVLPPVVARMLTSSFARMLLISTAVGAGCGFVGMYASFQLDVASGASIVLTGAAVFGVVYAVTGASARRRLGHTHV